MFCITSRRLSVQHNLLNMEIKVLMNSDRQLLKRRAATAWQEDAFLLDAHLSSRAIIN